MKSMPTAKECLYKYHMLQNFRM